MGVNIKSSSRRLLVLLLLSIVFRLAAAGLNVAPSRKETAPHTAPRATAQSPRSPLPAIAGRRTRVPDPDARSSSRSSRLQWRRAPASDARRRGRGSRSRFEPHAGSDAASSGSDSGDPLDSTYTAGHRPDQPDSNVLAGAPTLSSDARPLPARPDPRARRVRRRPDPRRHTAIFRAA